MKIRADIGVKYWKKTDVRSLCVDSASGETLRFLVQKDVRGVRVLLDTPSHYLPVCLRSSDTLLSVEYSTLTKILLRPLMNSIARSYFNYYMKFVPKLAYCPFRTIVDDFNGRVAVFQYPGIPDLIF